MTGRVFLLFFFCFFISSFGDERAWEFFKVDRPCSSERRTRKLPDRKLIRESTLNTLPVVLRVPAAVLRLFVKVHFKFSWLWLFSIYFPSSFFARFFLYFWLVPAFSVSVCCIESIARWLFPPEVQDGLQNATFERPNKTVHGFTRSTQKRLQEYSRDCRTLLLNQKKEKKKKTEIFQFQTRNRYKQHPYFPWLRHF